MRWARKGGHRRGNGDWGEGKRTESVEVSSDDTTSDRVHDGDDEANDDGAVGEEREGNEGVAGGEALPQDEADAANTTHDQEGDRVTCIR